jgi:hypothetical protein
MCVDKGLDELSDFETFVAESRAAGPAWQVLFAAGLGGSDGQSPSAAQIDQALQTLVERVRDGRLEGLLALDPLGAPLNFE